MVRVESYYDKEKITNIAKKMKVKSLVTSSILSLILLAMACFNFVSAFSEEKVNIFSIIVGALVGLFSIYPIASAIKTNKNSVKRAVSDMGVEEHPLTISYLFKEKRVEITLTQNGETKFDTLMMKNIDKVKVNKDGLGIYLLNGDMYYVYNEDFIEGDKQKLINLFARNKIKVK